jgi:hypothetical protein
VGGKGSQQMNYLISLLTLLLAVDFLALEPTVVPAASLGDDPRVEALVHLKSAYTNRPYVWVLAKDLPLTQFMRIGIDGKKAQALN